MAIVGRGVGGGQAARARGMAATTCTHSTDTGINNKMAAMDNSVLINVIMIVRSQLLSIR